MSTLTFPLSEKWIPNELLVRDKQLNLLLEKRRNYWITGGRGLGKSLTAKMVSNMVDGAFLLTCESQIFRDSVKTFALKHGVIPKSTEHPITTICNVLTKDKHDRLMLFIDDVDKLGRYFRRDFTLYLHDLYDRLLELPEEFSVNIITTVPYNRIENYLSAPTTSRLKFKPLDFPRYSKDEVVLLLKQRLNFIEGIKAEEEALQLIGERISRIGGDFRKALEMTQNALVNYTITMDSVEEAWKAEKHSFWKDQILGLPYHEALLLACAVNETLTLNENPDKPPYLPASWKKIKNRYENHCNQIKIPPLRDGMRYYWLEQLCLEGLLQKFALPKTHEWNYIHERSLFIRLLEKLENLVDPIKEIDWSKEW